MHFNRRHLSFIATTFVTSLLVGACASSGRDTGTKIPGSLKGTEILPDPVWPNASALEQPFSVIDVERYDIDVTLQPKTKSIDAEVTVEFRVVGGAPLNEVALDFEGLSVQSVVDSSGQKMEFHRGAGSLIVTMGEGLDLDDKSSFTVSYSGQPQAGLYFVPGEGDDSMPGQVFTQGECEDTRYWLPCIDTTRDRAIWDMTVTMPSDWVSLAAGDRLTSEVRGGQKVDIWRMTVPTPAYLISLVAGSFDRSVTPHSGIPVELLLPKGWKDHSKDLARFTGMALDFMAKFTGRDYPYSKYGTSWVDGFPYGGMENASATTLTANSLADRKGLQDGNPLGLIAHEAAHQWFGDLLTCEDWSQIWLQEGFATFASAEFLRGIEGEGVYLAKWTAMRDGFLQRDGGDNPRGLVHSTCIDPMDLFFTGHAYQGGAIFLAYLRSHIGEEAFLRGVRFYVGANAGRSVSTDDLRDAFERAAGRSLGVFFKQWVLQAGHPEFESSWRYDSERKRILIALNQVHDHEGGLPPVFVGSMGVDVRTSKGSTYHRIEFNARRQTVELPCSSRPAWVRLDPESVLPGKLTEKRTERDWLNLGVVGSIPGVIGEGSPFDVTARLSAVEHFQENLAEISKELKEARLNRVLRLAQSDPSPFVQEHAIHALLLLSGESSREAMRFLAGSSNHTRVRIAAMNALIALEPVDITAGFSKATYAVGHSWKTMGAAMTLWVKADPVTAWARLQIESDSAAARRNLGPELVNASKGILTAQRLPWLMRKAAASEGGSRLRQAAISALGKYSELPEVRDLLIETLQSPFFSARSAAVGALLAHLDPVGRQALIRYYEGLTDVRQRRNIERALKVNR